MYATASESSSGMDSMWFMIATPSGRREVGGPGGVRGHAHVVQALLARGVHEHHVLGEVVGRARPQEALAGLRVLAELERVVARLLVGAAEALPLVHP